MLYFRHLYPIVFITQKIGQQKMKHLSESQFNELVDLSWRNPGDALRILSIYEKEYLADKNLQENLGGLLIDIGSSLRDISVIQRGIDIIE